jgi:hypothetical protein
MAIDAATLKAYREVERRMADTEPSDALQALTSIPAIIGYLYSAVRSDGCSEDEACDQVELLVTEANLDRDQVKDAARLLQHLGYGEAVIDRLKTLARRARKPKPGGRFVGMFAPSHRKKIRQ